MNPSNQVGTAIKQPLIQCELSDLENTIAELADTVDRLLGRIEPVLLPTPPSPPDKPAPADAVLPLIGDRIRSSRRQLLTMVGRIADANRRIEL